MEFSLPEFPSAPGAQAAFVAAAIGILLGLALLLFPQFTGRFVGLESRETRTGAIGELRASGGFLVGLSLSALMFDQPVLYTALGCAFALAAFGRIISLMSDQAATFLNFLLLGVQIVLAGATLYYFFEVFTPDMQFAMPAEPAVRLVFYSFGLAAALGAIALFAPRIACRAAGLQAIADSGITSVRSAGGLAVGLGLYGLLMSALSDSAPIMTMMAALAFGAALGFGVIGRIVALVVNRGNYVFAGLALVLQAACTFVVLSYVKGMM